MIKATRYAVLVLGARLVGVRLSGQTECSYQEAEEKRSVRADRQTGGHGSPSHTYIHHHGLDGDVCKETNKSQRWVNQAHMLT